MSNTENTTDRNTEHAPESVLRAALGLRPEPWAIPATIGPAYAPVTVLAAFGIADEPVHFLGHRAKAGYVTGDPTAQPIEWVVATWDGESPEWANGRYFPATSEGIGRAWRRFLRNVTEVAADTEGDQRDAAFAAERDAARDPRRLDAAQQWPGDWTPDTAADFGSGD